MYIYTHMYTNSRIEEKGKKCNNNNNKKIIAV